MDDHTFILDWRVLGLANSPEERWTLTFEAEKLDLRVKFGSFGVGSELSVDDEAGG